MKKIILFIGAFIICTLVMNTKAKEVIIPDSAIRLRVIPNSNAISDQQLKGKVRDKVQKELYNLLKDTKSIEEARTLIEENLEGFEVIVEDTLKENKIEQELNINFGMNYFPQKVYKGITYEAGYYESLVITLGKGEGDNWWCVLFPPLCLLEAEESEETTEVEYKSFVKELIDKFF